ncbi:DNA cytosine methyltransferase [Alistipes sp.]|uniref:DNA cytosine methyltransferase n=2 Tax=Alistipes TaxID=239759 RepID=UPI0011DD92C0|nr:DNA cytosine methyltransferase [Alistipes sp.]
MGKYSLIDLFAGCGGLSLGMEQAGFEPVFVNEINATFCETYINNHRLSRDRYYIGDINQLNAEIEKYLPLFKDVDIVCGGPPCQGFSMANRQRIIDDPRNTLYKAYLQFLQYVKPKFFLMENVRGMAQKIDEIIDDLHVYLGKEYTFAYSLLNAKDFGVPQNRIRFIIIGNRIGVDVKQIFNDIKSDTMPVFTLGDAICDLPKLKPNRIKNNNSIENEDCGFERTEYEYLRTDFYNFINNGRKISVLYNHKNRYNNDRDIKIFGTLPQGANSLHPSIADIMPYKNRNHIFKDKYFKLNENEICKTITSHMKFDCNMYIHPREARGLTPREAARIQTFPDDYVFTGPQNSWYAQIGNAVPVKLAAVIGKHIIKHLK